MLDKGNFCHRQETYVRGRELLLEGENIVSEWTDCQRKKILVLQVGKSWHSQEISFREKELFALTVTRGKFPS